MKAIRTKEVNENVKAANSCLRKAKWQAKELAVFTGEVVRLMDKEGHSLQGFFNRVEFVLVDGTIKFRVVINPILECENCIMASCHEDYLYEVSFVIILYFNDYKLIYIITMMGKINNIPVLNEDVIRLVVLNEEIIGYIYPRRTSYVVALEIKPGRTTSLATSVNKQCMVLLSDKVRLATEQDFDDFHICFDGFRNNTMYCYNQGTEPIYLQ